MIEPSLPPVPGFSAQSPIGASERPGDALGATICQLARFYQLASFYQRSPGSISCRGFVSKFWNGVKNKFRRLGGETRVPRVKEARHTELKAIQWV
jgi:hypothetical protein